MPTEFMRGFGKVVKIFRGAFKGIDHRGGTEHEKESLAAVELFASCKEILILRCW